MGCGEANGLAGEKKVWLRGVTGGESGPVVVDVVLECVSPSDAPLRLGGASFSLVERDIVDSTSKDQKTRDYKGP
jgi:hypothetical protein